jgi:hypothetical protein
MTTDRNKLLELAKEAGCVFDQRYKGEVTFISNDALERFAALLQAQGEPELVAPHIIEALSYHARERDDLTLDEVLDYLKHGWKKVHGRSERELILQITALLAGTPPSSDQVWNETAEWLRNNYQDYTNIADLCDAMRKRPSQAQEPTADLLAEARKRIAAKLPEDEPDTVPDWVCELLINLGWESK